MVWQSLCLLFCRSITVHSTSNANEQCKRIYNNSNDLFRKLEAHTYGHIPFKVLQRCCQEISFGITDETFAIAVKRFEEGKADWLYNLKLNTLCYISWVSGTVVGLIFGYLIPLNLVDVFSFCLVAPFIFIATASVEKRFDVVVAVVAGVVAILLSSLPKGWNIVLACLVGCLVGGVYEWRLR